MQKFSIGVGAEEGVGLGEGGDFVEGGFSEGLGGEVEGVVEGKEGLGEIWLIGFLVHEKYMMVINNHKLKSIFHSLFYLTENIIIVLYFFLVN